MSFLPTNTPDSLGCKRKRRIYLLVFQIKVSVVWSLIFWWHTIAGALALAGMNGAGWVGLTVSYASVWQQTAGCKIWLLYTFWHCSHFCLVMCIECFNTCNYYCAAALVVLHIYMPCALGQSFDWLFSKRFPYDEFTTSSSPITDDCVHGILTFFSPPYLSPHSNKPCDGLLWFLLPIQSTSCCTAWWAGSILCMTPAASVGRFQLFFSSNL